MTRRKARAAERALQCKRPCPEREIVMEVLLLLLDEIDDLCAIAWRRTVTLFE